jgi:hypothetical protein
MYDEHYYNNKKQAPSDAVIIIHGKEMKTVMKPKAEKYVRQLI